MRTGVQDRPAVQVGVDDRASAQFPLLAVTGFAGLFKRPASRWARAALVAVNLAAVTAFLLSYSRHGVGFGPYRIDLGVYRFAGPAPQWAPWQQAIGSSYVIFAAFILLLAASGRLTPQTPTARTTPDPDHSALGPISQQPGDRHPVLTPRA